ncbi:VCBS repeat-containing protein [Candidatus Poribacteria bacterium]|nr:VCBS repeat-containing protein [Candidatus Poribacteria bacterium]
MLSGLKPAGCKKPLLIILAMLMPLSAAQAHAEENATPSTKPAPFVSFLEKTLLKVPAARRIEVGDFNGDHSPDLIFVTSDPSVIWVSCGDGKGKFLPPKKQGFGGGYKNAVVGATLIATDVDGDGKDEIVTFQERRISSESSEASLFLVTSSLKDESLNERFAVALPAGFSASSQPFVFGEDMNGDKKTDFVFGTNGDTDLFVMSASTGSQMPSTDSIARMSSGADESKSSFQALALDADNDGATDILKVGEQQIIMIRGEKDVLHISGGSVKPELIVSNFTGPSFDGSAIILHGRMNGDDFDDLFVVDRAGIGWVLLNVGGERFSTFLSLGLSGYALIQCGDFNGDGLSDLVVAGGGYDGLKVQLNSGEAHFDKIIERHFGGKPVSCLRVCDVNNDGLSDIIVILRGSLGMSEGRVLLNISQRLKK